MDAQRYEFNTTFTLCLQDFSRSVLSRKRVLAWKNAPLLPIDNLVESTVHNNEKGPQRFGRRHAYCTQVTGAAVLVSASTISDRDFLHTLCC